MKTVLERLYDGEMRPEEINRPTDKAYLRLKREIKESEAGFIKRLDHSESGQFEDFMEMLRQASSMETEDAYIQGMRMGAQLILELLGGSVPPCASQQP